MDSIPPNAEAPDDFPTEEEFKEALKDPAYLAHFHNIMRETLSGRFGDVPPELREAAAKAVKAYDTGQTMQTFRAKMSELCALIARPPGAYRGNERLSEAKRLLDELTD